MTTKISQLPAATALDGTEFIPVVQGGVTKQSTTAAVTRSTDGIKSDLASTASPTLGDYLVGVKLNASGSLATTQHEFNSRWVSTKDFCVGDGTTDDTTAFNNARAAAIALSLPLRIFGTPLIKSSLTISSREHWIFDGYVGNATGSKPSTYLKKDASLAGDLVTITASDTLIEFGGIIGVAGNTGDGYVINANGVILNTPYVQSMGQDGIRIGKDSGANSNTFLLIRPTSSLNGRYGIKIHDNTGSPPNANAGTMIAPFVQSNTSHGIYINNATSNTIIGVLAESNTGYGIYLDAVAALNNFYGGDTEANTAGAIYTEVATGGNGFNMLDIGTVSGTVTNNGVTNVIKTALNQVVIDGTWVPTCSGVSLTVTSATYSRRGKQVFLAFDITWPVTADATAVTIAGMGTTPGAPAANGGTFSSGYTTYANPIHGVAGAAGIALYNKGGTPSTQLLNSDLSGKRVIGSCSYLV